MFLKNAKKYLIALFLSLSFVNIFSMEVNSIVACIENESEYILMSDVVKDLSIKIADALYTNKDDQEAAHSNFMAILRINTILMDVVKEKYIEFSQIVISCDEEGIKYISRTFVDTLCNYERQGDTLAYIMEDIRNNYSAILEMLESELNFKPPSLVVEDDVKLEVFKNIIRSLSLTISHFLYMDEELKEYARCDIYGIFFDTLRSSYEEIASRALAGETKDIKDLSKQLLSAVYRDCDAFVRDFSSSDNLILNKMIRKVENIALDIRAREEDVLEKIESVLLGFEKKSIFFTMKRVLEIARKPAMVISGGVTTLAGLAIKFEGSYYAPMILPYSGGIFIVVTVTPSVFRWVSSLF